MTHLDYRVLRWIYLAVGFTALGVLLLVTGVATGSGWVLPVAGVAFGFVR
jgi:hypothetical protein